MATLKSIWSSVSAVILLSPSASKNNSTPFVSKTLNASLLNDVITYIAAEFAGAAVNVILFKSPDPFSAMYE